LRAYVAHVARGEIRQALNAVSEACHAEPELPQAQYAYGEAWLALGEPARAEQAFAAAVRLRPAWADAWVNYGLARYRQGAIEDAKTAMRRALAAEPGHAAACGNLGAFLRITGESEAGEALLAAAVAAAPDNAGARLNLAAELLQEERADEALALLEDAHAPAAADLRVLRHWRLQKSLACLQLRRFAEARQTLDALAALGPIPPEIMPLWRWRRALLALGEGRPVAAGREAERMERALAAMGPDATPEHAITARFDLAKFWSGQGEPAAAFEQWREGHALLKRFQPFSRDEHRAFIDANIAAFTRARFTDGACAGNRDPAPVFIVGLPRSGTTLCEQILAAHAEAHGAGERVALARTFAELGGGAEAAAVARVAKLRRESLDAAATDYLAALRALAPQAKRVIDKMPGNYLHLGLVGLMLPGATIIHCARDPRDIGLSIFTFRFHGHHGYAHDLADLGWTIAEHERLMAHWKRELPNAVLTVRLSDWVEHFDATLARVLAHVGLPHDPNCARFYERESRVRTVSRSQVRQPVNARGLGRWRAYESELQPLIAELERAGALDAWRDAPVGRV
jgi:Tfp pilus assembly protein PilF